MHLPDALLGSVANRNGPGQGTVLKTAVRWKAGGLAWLALAVALVAAALWPARGQAQQQVWVQIEAQPTVAEARERARAYGAAFPDVTGYALQSGWFRILLGPYDPAEAEARLRSLLAEGLIAPDSFIDDGANFLERFWPEGAATTVPDPTTALLDQPIPTLAEESPEQARAGEQALTQTEREEVQAALRWLGLYDASIDGAFGSGTRAAMAAWQDANGAVATGVLTTAQRGTLIAGYRSAMAELGLQRVSEAEAGIEIDLPLGMMEFDRYEPPFVRYAPVNDSGVSALLISQPGDETALAGLYDLMQSVPLVPPAGDRRLDDQSFEITGRNAQIESYTYAALKGGVIKGFTLVWPVADRAKMTRVLDAMKSSFRPIGTRALDPGLVPLTAAQREGMLSGLDLGRPALSRSGFFVDGKGSVLTTPDVLQSCARVTIEGDIPMSVAFSDAAAGVAVLVPDRPLSPPAFATFQTAPDRTGAEVAVAGYPYEDRLSAPTLTFGVIAAQQGLNGEPGVRQLALTAQPGDAGGPVVDGTGAVVGMLLPNGGDATRQLPPDAAFALSSDTLRAGLAAKAIALTAAEGGTPLPPEDLTRRARGMTVLVSCWR